ncbi:unnamed protein product [Brassicogethes aeneus]|uniref:Major facilitator superfamily (MFS) profile domain-containing protein n=1 Tax=Brassicogethes aeneus TaxID=1431903 RepID=A0A9P0BK67_BRAAE|nr:unnamed protein product [Brassicogethes aeneus]
MENSRAPLVRISSVAPSLEAIEENEENPDNMEKIDRRFQGRESVISSQVSLYIKTKNPKIPDGGWGWWVVFAAFIINMVSDGVCLTFGLLYVEFLHEFGASNSATSWIGSLFMAVPLLAGPVMSAMVDRYGCRSMTILGAIISATGFFASAFAPNIIVMYFTFGVIGGVGLGLCFVTAVVSIAFWFEKRRTVALGLGACGTGFGTLVFSPLSTFLIQEYHWRGTLIILSGCFLNLVVCGALMRDPQWVKDAESDSDDSSEKCSLNIEEIKESLIRGNTDEYILENFDTTLNLTNKPMMKSVVNLPTFVRQNETVPVEVLEKLSKNQNLYQVILENYPNLLKSKSSSEKGLNNITDSKTTTPVKLSMKLKKTEKITPPKDTLQIPPVKFIENEPHLTNKQKLNTNTHHYLKNIRFRRNSIMHRGAMLNTNRYRLKASSCPNIYRNSMMTLAQEEDDKWYTVFLEVVKDVMQFSLFLELHFFLLCLSTVILFTWFIVPYFYLVKHMTIFGYSENQASFVIAVIGVTNTIGMVVLGWAGDRPWMNVGKAYAICLMLCGIFCSAMLFFTSNHTMIVVCSGLFGLFFASTFSFTPTILADLVPIDNFTMAYGLVLLCQGIGNLIGPPLAGLLFDLTQSWDQSFYQAGFWIIISGVLAGVIPYTKNTKILGKKT